MIYIEIRFLPFIFNLKYVIVLLIAHIQTSCSELEDALMDCLKALP
jgi:hypothetical protein